MGYVMLGCTGQYLTVSTWLPFPKSVGVQPVTFSTLYTKQNAYPLITPQNKTINDRINDTTKGLGLG